MKPAPLKGKLVFKKNWIKTEDVAAAVAWLKVQLGQYEIETLRTFEDTNDFDLATEIIGVLHELRNKVIDEAFPDVVEVKKE